MNHINIINHNEPVKALRSAPRQTWVAYWEGDYNDQVHNTKVGRAAWELHEAGKAILCQKKIQDEPIRFTYYAVLK